MKGDYYGGFANEWAEYYSEEHKRPYWHNPRNKKTTWDSPEIILKALIQSGVVDDSKVVPDYWESPPEAQNIIKVVLKDGEEFLIDRGSMRIIDTEPEKKEEPKEPPPKKVKVEERKEVVEKPKPPPLVDDWKVLEEKYSSQLQNFRQMLKEKHATKSVPWEKALSQFIYDERYSELPKQYRKIVYEDFVKKSNVERMREEIKLKQEVEKQVRQMMEEYLEQGKITATTEYRQFEEFAKNDPRFLKSLQIDREVLLREFINAVRKAKEELKEAQRKEFRKMLHELNKSKIDENTKWGNLKKLLKNDPRYKAIGSKTEREKLFFEFVQQLSKEHKGEISAGHKRESPEKAAPRRDRKEEEKILLEIFKDHIKQTNFSWVDALKLIEKDKRYGELELSTVSMSYIYKDFIKRFKKERAERYKQLLREKKEITYKSNFEESKKLLESDERYLSLPRYERQNLFNDYVRELEDNIKAQFKQMMKESNYITKDSQVEGQSFEDLVKVLRAADVRFRRMDSWPEERDFLLKEFIMKLKSGKRKDKIF